MLKQRDVRGMRESLGEGMVRVVVERLRSRTMAKCKGCSKAVYCAKKEANEATCNDECRKAAPAGAGKPRAQPAAKKRRTAA